MSDAAVEAAMTVEQLEGLYRSGMWWLAFRKAVAQIKRLEAIAAHTEAAVEQARRALGSLGQIDRDAAGVAK